MTRLHTFDAVYNVRDFGDYAGEFGPVAKGRLFRGAHLNNATDADVARLEAMGINLAIDLRYKYERERQPSRWFEPQGPEIIAFDPTLTGRAPHEAFIENELHSASDARRYMEASYAKRPKVPAFQSIFSDTLKALAANGPSLYVHCAAGKDRTGTLVAIIQSILGVSESDIVEDYMLTNSAVDIDALLPNAAKFMTEKYDRPFDPEALRPMFGVETQYLTLALDAMNHDPVGYSQSVLGLEAADLNAIRAAYIPEYAS